MNKKSNSSKGGSSKKKATSKQSSPLAEPTSKMKASSGKASATEAKKKGSKAGKNKKQKKEKKNNQNELRNELKELAGVEAGRDLLRMGAAAIILLVTVFLFLALVSNIFTGAEDQAGVMSGEMFEAHNKAGYIGAIVSFYFMHQLFGFGSLLIPIFLSCVVLKLMMREACPIRLWVTSIHCAIIAFLISIDATYIQTNFLPDSLRTYFGFELGGMHGHDIVGGLEGFVGSTTTFVFLLILTISYIGYWFTQVFIWILKGVHKIGGLIPRREEDDTYEEVEEEDDTEHDYEPENLNETSSNTQPDTHSDNFEGPVLGGGTTYNGFIEVKSSEVEDEPIPTLDDDQYGPISLEPIITSSAVTLATDTIDPASASSTMEAQTLAPSTEEANAGSADELILIKRKEEKKANTHTAENTEDAFLAPYDPKADLSRYEYPPIDLLEKHTSSTAPTTREELEANKNRIIEVLRTFNVEISKISATVGPTVTLYEITPAPGVRIATIRKLEEDIALSLSAIGIRIIAPIPGKGTIGIEVPNTNPQVVSMESIVNTQKFKETKFELPIALGKTITNEMFMVDLAKMPHLLVAGATGQGKSVGLNAIITSLLYKKHPSELKIVMIDPKKVEFSMYNPIINHFLAQVPDSDEPVVTDVKKVITTLKSLCQEMDDRYDLLKNAHCRNIKEYNAKFCERHLLPTEGHHFLPYIVVIIDEFGDLIMTAGKEIELPIARIAQLARAVGIHMVIATQSPRATIITGKIKANFPARMAFRVSQGIESQTILDRRGANNLIGKGDMLFQAGSELTRVQCAFVDTPEVVAIAKHIEDQQGYPTPFELPLVAEDGGDGMEGISSQNGESTFEQVARYVVNTQQGSTSKIQRTFSVGFNRAGRLMDQLEEAGIVGPQMGSKPRQVLVQSEIELRQILDSLKENGINFD